MSVTGSFGAFTALFAMPAYAARRKAEQWKAATELARLQAERLRTLLRKARVAPYYCRLLPGLLLAPSGKYQYLVPLAR